MTDTPTPPTTLILGANGRLGLAAVQAFHAAGWQVIAALRGAPAPGMPKGVRVVHTPLLHTEQLASDAAGARVVIHAVNPHYTRWQSDLLPLAHAGMDLAQRLGARLMLPGNVYNFGVDMPPILHEDTPQRAHTRKGALRVRLEAELAQRCARGQIQATVVRAGDFFGGGTGSWLDQAIVKSLRAGRLVYPGPTGLPHAWAYLPDLAGTWVALASRAPDTCPPFERFHFPGHTLTGAEMLDAIVQAAQTLDLDPGRPWSRAGMPWTVIRVGGLLVPMWRELAEMAYLWSVPHALAGQALERAVGPRATTPLSVALRASLLDLGFGDQPQARTGPAAG
jgi:nucleoside-diphosphate-sugar epimerase